MALIIWGSVQTFRLEAARHETVMVTLEFESYKVAQMQAMLLERQRELEQREIERNESEKREQQIMADLDIANAKYDGVRSELARVRQAASRSATGNCTVAAHTIRVLTELLGCTKPSPCYSTGDVCYSAYVSKVLGGFMLKIRKYSETDL